MRPTTTSEAFVMSGGRSRKSSSANSTNSFASSSSGSGNLGGLTASDQDLESPGASSVTYFLADEATVNSAAMASSAGSLASVVGFGVHSLSSSGSTTELRTKEQERCSSVERKGNARVKGEEFEDEDGHEVYADTLQHIADMDSKNVTQGLTSVTTHLREKLEHASPPGSPFLGILKSPRSCDDFSEAASQAVVSGGEEEDSVLESPPPSSAASPTPRSRKETRMAGTDTTIQPPQFIMPTIKMPTRRPFTKRGRNVGRLKILVAGDSGIGKTSLIKAIVQSCEDIVHVDPLPTQKTTGRNSRTTSISSSYYALTSREDGASTKAIIEVYASTKPYPQWWSEHEDSKVLRRRKSNTGASEIVLERNICFVDTPGYGSGTSFAECVEPVVQYVETQMKKTADTLAGGEGDLLSLLSGCGTPQVDVVFYVILHRLKPVDVEYIRRLSPLTNVLPVIAKADSLTTQQIKALKGSILSDLKAAGIRPFLFGKSYEDVVVGSDPCAPFAISSAASSDQENMDASVLMSPDYVPPLVDTELGHLINHVFEAEHIAWLKHTAAKKYINWSTSGKLSGSLSTPQRSLTSSTLGTASSSLIQGTSPSFTLARISDHTQREERSAQVRLARWANDLQRSLRSEKERYQRLAKGERAIWLTERLNESIIDGQLVPVSSALISAISNNPNARRGQANTCEEWGGFSVKDPLGILESFRKVSKGAVLIECGGGILAILAAMWAWKNYGITLGELTEWIGSA